MNLINQDDRLALIGSIDSENNKARKQVSLKQFEVMGGRMQQYVKENLQGQLYQDSVTEMPIVSSINVQKAVVDKKATVYKKAPGRLFTETTDEQADTLNLIYKDMKLDSRLNKANKNYVYQDQSIGMIVPKNGKLIARIFAMHQIDAIVDPTDPEDSLGFIISAFDRTEYIQLDSELKERDTATGVVGRSNRSTSNSNMDELVAEKFQFQKYVAKYIVWTRHYNFMMNGLGEVIDPDTGEADTSVDIVSPLASENLMPFFEISRDKDFEYFTRSSNALTDFTIQFNERLSDLANIQKMNGYAVAILKTPSDLKPANLVIGNSQIIHLATDGEDGDKVDFEFTSPNSDISGISDANDKFLNYFVTSEGLSGDVVNSTGDQTKATSGIDRFIQSIQQIETHVDDYESFRCLEDEIYEIVKAWLRVLNGTDLLKSKYQVPTLNAESELEIKYYKPEMMETESEKLTNIDKRIDMGLMSKVEAIMLDREISDEDEAQAILDKIGDPDELVIPELPALPNIVKDNNATK
jgi:hypothetical protein